MAVERLTDYTRRIWTGLEADAPDPDMQVGDVIYYMDTSTCSIITGIPAPGSIDTEDLPDIGGGGGDLDITQYTTLQGQSINAAITAAAVPVKYQNEILIWNVTGTHQQASGSVGGKWGFQVVQNGAPVARGGWYQRSAEIAAPDSMTPGTGNLNAFNLTIVDGVFHATGGTAFNLGVGNIIEFVQIPYNINWNV